MAILQCDQVAYYLRDVGLLPAGEQANVEQLAGGVSSAVYRVTWNATAVVLKQALPKLQVSDEWTSRVERSATEARAASVLGRLLPSGAILPPLYVDERRCLFVMPSAPLVAETWKALLMRGELSSISARAVGQMLGQLHARSRLDPELAEEFADRQDFVALRVDPYLHVTAARRPEVAAPIEKHTARMLSVQECLVHGDYSPKNLLVEPDHPAAMILLDHEVCHWGDPTFDLAFCLTHLHLKACTFPERTSDFLDLAQTFWTAYSAVAAPPHMAELECDTVGMLGCLLAARVDGKSPAEYLTTEALRQRVRRLADAILLDELRTLPDVRDLTLTGATL
jgi:aminoglycoside phosphotransferase (APT) family kinase protein